MMLYKSWQIWMCGSLVCHHVYCVFYYCFVCCTYPSYFPFFSFLTELSWKLIKNVYLNRGPNKLMLQCPSLLHQMYMLFINWMYFICDNKLCWTCKKKNLLNLKAKTHLILWLMLTYHQWDSLAFTWGKFHRKTETYQSPKSTKIANWKWWSITQDQWS